MDTFVSEIYKKLSDLMKEASDLFELLGFTELPGNKCPFCHLNLEDYLKNISQSKYVDVNVRLDVYEIEKISAMTRFANIFNRAAHEHNESAEGKVKIKYLNRHMGWTNSDSAEGLNISKEHWAKHN